MGCYIRERERGLVELFCIVKTAELALLSSHQFKEFPARFFSKPYFFAFLSKEEALKIAKEPNNFKKKEARHLVRFLTTKAYIDQYRLIGKSAAIPKDKLTNFNSNIFGLIEKICDVDS